MALIFEWLDSNPFYWPAFIILARIADVSIGTVRTICVVRGYRAIASVLGFCEIMVWLFAVSGVLSNINGIKMVSYAAGFALGNFIGILVEQKLALGTQLIFMISRGKAHAIAFALRLADFLVTEIPAKGGRGDVAMSFVLVPRRKTADVVRIAKTVDENAFIVVEDVRQLSRPTAHTAMSPTGWRAILKKK